METVRRRRGDRAAPAAARLGIFSLKNRIESLAFPVVYPADAERITEQLTSLHCQYGAFLPVASAALRVFLEEQGMVTSVEVREKQPYSIFMKMRAKGMTAVSAVYDLFAFRVTVRSPEECYQVLVGILENLLHLELFYLILMSL